MGQVDGVAGEGNGRIRHEVDPALHRCGEREGEEDVVGPFCGEDTVDPGVEEGSCSGRHGVQRHAHEVGVDLHRRTFPRLHVVDHCDR